MKALLLTSVVLLPACALSVEEPDRSREAQAPALAPPDPSFWPARRTSDLDGIAAALPAILPPAASDEGGPLRLVAATPRGVGLVLALRPVAEDGTLLDPEAAPLLRFASFPPTKDAPIGAAARLAEGAIPSTSFTWKVPEEGEPRAIAVVVAGDGAGEAACAAELAGALRGRGFAVLEAPAPPLVAGTYEADVSTIEAVEPAALELARAIDLPIAERCYGVEGMLEHLLPRHAGLETSRILVLGVGEGARAAPAVALRLLGRVGAVVLIGAAADVLAVEEEREWEARRVRIRRTGAAAEADPRRWFHDVFLRECRLQPGSAAPWLRSLPVVLVSDSGNEQAAALWEQLAQPRWIVLGIDPDTTLVYAAIRTSLVLDDAVAACLEPAAVRE